MKKLGWLPALAVLAMMLVIRPDDLTYGQSMDLARQFGAAYDRLPDQPPADLAAMSGMVPAVMAEFKRRGIADKLIYPVSIVSGGVDGGAAEADCLGRTVTLAPAGMNVVVLAHELAHLQQGALCNTADRDQLETTAQIVALEIVAGMVHQGNRDAEGALLDTLRRMSLNSAHLLTTDESQFVSDRASVMHDPLAESLMTNDPAVMRVYSQAPLTRILAAIRGNHAATGLVLPAGDALRLDELAWFFRSVELQSAQ